VRQIGAIRVDVEADLVPVKVETDHPSIREKVVGFSHREDRKVTHAPKNCGLASAFVAAQEQDVAALNALLLVKHADA